MTDEDGEPWRERIWTLERDVKEMRRDLTRAEADCEDSNRKLNAKVTALLTVGVGILVSLVTTALILLAQSAVGP